MSHAASTAKTASTRCGMEDREQIMKRCMKLGER